MQKRLNEAEERVSPRGRFGAGGKSAVIRFAEEDSKSGIIKLSRYSTVMKRMAQAKLPRRDPAFKPEKTQTPGKTRLRPYQPKFAKGLEGAHEIVSPRGKFGGSKVTPVVRVGESESRAGVIKLSRRKPARREQAARPYSRRDPRHKPIKPGKSSGTQIR